MHVKRVYNWHFSITNGQLELYTLAYTKTTPNTNPNPNPNA